MNSWFTTYVIAQCRLIDYKDFSHVFVLFYHLTWPPRLCQLISVNWLPVSVYCANPKTVNSRIISGMLLCCEEKANQMQDEKTANCKGNQFCGLRFFICSLIGHRTIKMSKSNQSVHGFWIRTVLKLFQV